MSSSSARVLDREEYVEQAYFFKSYSERLTDNLPAQEILTSISEELLATTNLPKAIEFLKGEILLKGKVSDGMQRLPHYFTPFQTYVMARAEEDKSRFDISIALHILQRLAEYMSENPTRPGLFIYQFECLARNRLGYDAGMLAIAEDPFFDEDWKNWLQRIRFQLGEHDFCDLIYYRSEQYVEERRHRTREPDYQPSYKIFFGRQEGRIAKANQGKDPLYMFSALQRQLNYPKVPRIKPKSNAPILHPAVEMRLQRLEQRLQLLESEAKDEFDLSQFYVQGNPSPKKLEND
ncbi:MAG: hypothetical protein KDA65_15635 [Planctomycetaceae bacterium]|nr:hypothetical protein [Planctomycetaceae bacterium]